MTTTTTKTVLKRSTAKLWRTNLNLLSCAICRERYKDPKVLPCLHTFCERCLNDVIPPESLSVTCPVCRQQSILPIEGVSALQNNIFFVNLFKTVTVPDICKLCGSPSGLPSLPTSLCLDCRVYLCDTCRIEHISMDNTNNNSANDSNIFNNHDLNGVSHHDNVTDDAEDENDDHSNNGSQVRAHTIVKLPELASRNTVAPATNGSAENDGHESVETIVCPNHAGSKLKYYCSHCDTAVCEACTQAEHIGHETENLSDAVRRHKASLTCLVKRVRALTPTLEKAIENVDDIVKEMKSNTRKAKEKVETLFDELESLVKDRKHQALTEIQEVALAKENILDDQKSALKEHLTRLESCCKFTEDLLQQGKDTDVLLVTKEMDGKLNDVMDYGQLPLPHNNPLMVFDDRNFDGFQEKIKELGSVCNNTAVHYRTSVVGGESSLSGCVAGKATTVTVVTRDKDEEPVKVGFADITASISSDKTEDKLVPTITDHHNGSYDITFVLQSPGVYYLSIWMFGEQIRHSPYKIRAVDISEVNGNGSSRIPRTMAVKQKGVKRPSSSRSQGSSNRRTTRIEDDLIKRIGVKGRQKGEFANPQGLCCHDGIVLVADSNNQNVQVFAPSGECTLKFGTPGRAPGKIQRPTGVAVTHNGNYLVADYDNKWIGVFSPEGKYMNRIGAGRLQGPKGVTVDKEGRIIVVDNKSSCVLIYQTNGKFIHKFGSRGNRDEQFAGPHYAAVNEENDIIVSDFHNHCVKVFDSDGSFKFSFGSNGEGNGQFNAPTGVAVDEKGNILVADWGNSRIQVFDSNGSFLSFVNTAGEPLYGPQGLAVVSLGTAVVADSGNHCIKYYKYLQ